MRAPGSASYVRLKGLMRAQGLHTVCEEAHCPNIGECWHHGTATFMILGEVCTRACPYCAVQHGRPAGLDREEPSRVAEGNMALNYVVITSVDRDDLPDGGSGIFAETIRGIRRQRPSCRVEVLIPDFKGDEQALYTVLDAAPDVLNHNTELLDRARRYAPDIPTKSGLMVGIGEQWPELIATLADLREVGVGIITIGQYLSPSAAHLPVDRFYHPDEFEMLKATAVNMGFGHVECGPLVRSSYHAHEQADAFERAEGRTAGD